MTEAQITLARRAVACKGWKWLPGMLTTGGERVLPNVLTGSLHLCDPPRVFLDSSGSCLPDFQDPATLGCLLALAREAWENPKVWAEYVPDSAMWSEGDWQLGWACPDGEPIPPDIECDTEAEALVAALEAAP